MHPFVALFVAFVDALVKGYAVVSEEVLDFLLESGHVCGVSGNDVGSKPLCMCGEGVGV